MRLGLRVLVYDCTFRVLIAIGEHVSLLMRGLVFRIEAVACETNWHMR
jgi:hypothetical protein